MCAKNWKVIFSVVFLAIIPFYVGFVIENTVLALSLSIISGVIGQLIFRKCGVKS